MVGKAKADFALLSPHAKGIIYGVLSAVGVSGYLLVNRHIYAIYDVDTFGYAVTFSASAGLFALLAMAIGAFARGKALSKSSVAALNLSALSQLLVIGFAGGLAMALVAVGQGYTSAINAGIIMTSSLIFTCIFSIILLKDRFYGGQWLWLLVMFIGLYVGVVGLRIVTLHAGDLIIFGAMAVLGFNNTFSKIAMRNFSPNTVADSRLMISAALMLITGLIFAGSGVLVTNAGLWPLLAGGFLWLCIRTFYAAVHYINPNYAIVLNNSQIFFTALAGIVLLAESYDVVTFVGSALVLLSVYFITKK